MKKQIEITKQSTETIEVEMPSYYENYGMYIAITDHSVIKISKEGLFINVWTASKANQYSEAIVEVLKWEPTTITAEEFEAAFHNTIKCLTEQYQLSKSMMDPNQQQPANQEEASNDGQPASEQVAATESAAQDTAMGVDAEEGTTEG